MIKHLPTGRKICIIIVGLLVISGLTVGFAAIEGHNEELKPEKTDKKLEEKDISQVDKKEKLLKDGDYIQEIQKEIPSPPEIKEIKTDRKIDSDKNIDSAPRAGNTLWVDNTDMVSYNKTKYAVQNATDGDTIKVNGTGVQYEESFNVNNNNLLIQGRKIGNGMPTINCTGSGYLEFRGNGNNLTNFNVINGSDYNILIMFGDDNQIFGNGNITGSSYTIVVYGGSNNIISRNKKITNTDYGVLNYAATNTTISNNQNITNTDYGVFNYDSTNTTISNNQNIINNTYMGIFDYQSENTTVSFNHYIDDNQFGVLLYECKNTTIKENHVMRNRDGIYTISSSHIEISNNNIADHRMGLYMHSTNHTIVTDNTFQDDSIMMRGDHIMNWYSHTFSGNTANGDDIYYFKNQTGSLTYTNPGEIILANCSEVNPSNVQISDVDGGIVGGFSEEVRITNSNVSHSTVGVYLEHSSYSDVMQSSFYNNSDGIRTADGTNYINISDNPEIKDNQDGVVLYGNRSKVRKNSFYGNNISVRIRSYFYADPSNSIINNTIRKGVNGIYLDGSYNNTVKYNEVSNNTKGFNLTNINDDPTYDENLFHHNDIIQNTYQVYSSDNSSYNCSWNTTGSSGTDGRGNYWSDYTGSDTDGDGIGDTKTPWPDTDMGNGYYNLDHFPLVEPSDGGGGDTTPPTVNRTDPADDSSGVKLTKNILVEFNESINTSTFEFVADPDPGGWGEMWSSNNTTVTLSHDIFSPTTEYTINITGAEDEAGNQLDGDGDGVGGDNYSFNFTTESNDAPTSEVDDLPSSKTHAEFEIGYSAQDDYGLSSITLYYRYNDQSWEEASTDDSISGTSVSSSFMFNTTDYNGDGHYEFYSLARDTFDKEENKDPLVEAETVVDTVPPSIIDMSPGEGKEEVSVDSELTVEFSEEMDRSSVTITVSSGDEEVQGTTEFNENGTKMAFKPKEELDHDTNYNVTVSGEDMHGNSMNKEWSFTTEKKGLAGIPWWVLILIAAVVIGGIIVALAMKRRKGEEFEEPYREEGGPREPPEEGYGEESGGVEERGWEEEYEGEF